MRRSEKIKPARNVKTCMQSYSCGSKRKPKYASLQYNNANEYKKLIYMVLVVVPGQVLSFDTILPLVKTTLKTNTVTEQSF
jgi:hypothetical protein